MNRFIFSFLCFLLISTLHSQEYSVVSPSGELRADVNAGQEIKFSVSLNGKEIISPSEISLTINEVTLGKAVKSVKARYESVNRVLEPVVRQKTDFVEDVYNEIDLQFRGNYNLVFRAYDDGIAYRWESSLKDSVIVNNEEVNFVFPADFTVWFPEETSMFTHQERAYIQLPLSEINEKRFSSVPALVDAGNNIKIAITEADLFDYPGMYLTGSSAKAFQLTGIFPHYPRKEEMVRDRDVKVSEREDYMAKTSGSRTFPWRVMVISREDGDLIESQMIFKLSRPSETMDFSWIKPGKVAWDWWNANNVFGVDFKSGINTETYKYYIDFASKYGLEYIILDEGWYELGDLSKVNPEINITELVRYGREKNVGIILWVVWKTLWDQLDIAMDQFENWGIQGIKVDFMQRDDQWMVNYYWKIAEEAAQRHLLVDFHGSYKPAGLHRTWPNVLTREGVRGLEWNKWSDVSSPEHAVTLPFIRMLAGPMDYTPGAMINATKEEFRPVFDKPMSQGTRCQQLAMYVIYESPLQMLADSPSHYEEEEECMDFLKAVPVEWERTIVLDGVVGDYVVIARKNGSRWFLGAMTDWTPRDIEISLNFLEQGVNSAILWKDGPNADRYAEDFKVESIQVSSSDKIKLHLAPGGGCVAIFQPK